MWLTLIVVLALAAYRVARFLIDDALIQTPRIYLHTFILGRNPDIAWRGKLHELLTCYWCLTIWTSGAAVIIADQFVAVPLPWIAWLAVAQGAMLVHRSVE